MTIFNGGPGWLPEEEGVDERCWTVATSTSYTNLSCILMIFFLQIFYRESSCLVWSNKAASLSQCRSNVLLDPSPRSFSVLIIVWGGRAESCLRRVIRDPTGLGFRWIRLNLAGFRGLPSFYRPLSSFSSPGQRFASHITIASVS